MNQDQASSRGQGAAMSAGDRRNLGKFRKYSRRLNRMLEDGSFAGLPSARRQSLVGRIRRLYRNLVGIVPDVTLRSILAAAAVVVLGVSACTDSSTRIRGDGLADTGVDPGYDPGIDPGFDPGTDPWPDPGIDPWPDPGHDPGWDPSTDPATDPSTPRIFGDGRLNPFGIDTTRPRCGWSLAPALADIDDDADIDLFGGSLWYEYSSCLKFFENTGTPHSPSFAAAVVDPFGVSGRDGSGPPALADIDGDGDYDLFVGSGDYWYGGGRVMFWENVGTPGSPRFTSPVRDPFGITGIRGYYTLLAFADIDGDADLDLFSGTYDYWGGSSLQWHENRGSRTSPSFASPARSPFGISVTGWNLAPAFTDIDRDGDLDLFVGGGSYSYPGGGGIRYQQNVGTRTAPAFASAIVNPFGLSIPFYNVYPAFADMDGDGDMDLMLGANYSLIIYYENTTF
jgi:hypothetical protein